MSISIHLNGDTKTLAGPMTVAAVLAEFELEARKIAVERNLEIVPRSTYGDVVVEDGDRLEIVRFVGGG